MQATRFTRLFVAFATVTTALVASPAATAAPAECRAAPQLGERVRAIRSTVEQSVPAIRAGNFRFREYAELGRTVEAQVVDLTSHCRLPPAADAALHEVVAMLWDGVDAITGRGGADARTRGVDIILAALDRYGRRFDEAVGAGLPVDGPRPHSTIAVN